MYPLEVKEKQNFKNLKSQRITCDSMLNVSLRGYGILIFFFLLQRGVLDLKEVDWINIGNWNCVERVVLSFKGYRGI